MMAIVLVANFGIVSGAQSLASSDSQVASEHRLFDQAQVLVGSGALGLLISAQRTLAGSDVSCDNPFSAVKDAAFNYTVDDSTLSLSVSEVLAPYFGPSQTDNLTSLGEYDGSNSSVFGFTVDTRVNGSDESEGVWYAKSETHFVELPVAVRFLVSLCEEAAVVGMQALSSSNGSSCSVLEEMLNATLGKFFVALPPGFTWSSAYATYAQTPCSIAFTVGVAQSQVRGPGGAFSFGVSKTVQVRAQGPSQ
jgi:hypothetical protein